ncbi:hypothetical protein [Teredinibacter sp. KSP-S5-2]|uniref:hypothetical protein n=1 Tax=Teredinibacter sp. KSP-S5-2 TaxID=3034506 RepID=UPI002934AE41|nr:hypothetical protein [Teredinibacter sp. KSP-S5-2]WNO11267.1 hypothetical protein P5V12_08795 [Teredinibacter sp. KSP-S5-2]
MDWKLLIAVTSLPVVFGVLIDTWMTAGQKDKLYDRLCLWFLKIEDTTLPNLPKVMASSSVGFVHGILGTKWVSKRSLLIMMLGSTFITSAAIISGAILSKGSILEGLDKSFEFVSYFHILLPVNYVFDGLTFIITVSVLVKLTKNINLFSILVVLFDIALAFLFGVLCLSFSGAFIDHNITNDFAGFFEDFYFNIPRYWDRIVGFFIAILSWDFSETREPEAMLYGSTTLLPTIGYFLFFYFLIFARFILWIGRLFAVQWIQVATENLPKEDSSKFKPFTLIGLAFSGMLGVIKIAQEIII